MTARLKVVFKLSIKASKKLLSVSLEIFFHKCWWYGREVREPPRGPERAPW